MFGDQAIFGGGKVCPRVSRRAWNSPDLLARVMQRSSRHADEFGQRRRRVFSTPRNGRLQRIGREAKRPIDHAILIDLAGGCRNQRNARAHRHHPEDHLQMIDFVRRMRDEACLAAGPEYRLMKDAIFTALCAS